MAGKLKDDQIRIILDVEATGVQAKLQQITAETLRLSDANKQMKADLKDYEKAMNNAEKAMIRLEAAGKSNTKEYAYARDAFVKNAATVADYKQKIEANTKAIADNDKQTKETIKTMSIQDMTMSQLKQRAADLQNQMNYTSQSLSPEAYKKLGNELDQVKDRMTIVERSNKNLLEKFATMHNPVGHAAKAILGFGDAIKTAFQTNPVLAIITLIVGVFGI